MFILRRLALSIFVIFPDQTHFANEVTRFVKEAMREYSALTGRAYGVIRTFMTDDADHVVSAWARTPTTPRRSPLICAARARRSA